MGRQVPAIVIPPVFEKTLAQYLSRKLPIG